MATLEIKCFTPRAQGKHTEARKLLLKSMPHLEGVFKKRTPQAYLASHWVARVQTDMPGVPTALQEMSIIAFAFMRSDIKTLEPILIVPMYESHGGLGLDPAEMLTESKTGGVIYGQDWIRRFYPHYNIPIYKTSLSCSCDTEQDQANNFQGLFLSRVEDLKKSMARIENAFAI